MEKTKDPETVRVAHAILSHTGLEQVGKLAQALAHPNADVYIHIDKKVPNEVFQSAVRQLPNCHFITQRGDIRWGGYSMVRATLDVFSEIRSTDRPYHFINLLSGSDYPLQPMHRFHEFLGQNIGKSFLEYEVEGSAWWDEAKTRFERYHFPDVSMYGIYTAQRLINFLTPKRKKPLGMDIVGRSQWFTISAEHLDYVLAYVKATPAIERFFKYTWGPDELFFQTILLNSEHRTQIINDNLRYIDWKEHLPSPKTLTEIDFPAIKSSGKFFARKFNTNVSSKLVEQIDMDLLGTLNAERA